MGMRGYVYQIQSKVKPYRVYIGSSYQIKDRWSGNKRSLFLKKHHSLKLQRHYNKYGIDDLIFSIIEEFDFISRPHLFSREQYYLDILKPYFNMSPSAVSTKGLKYPTKTIKKIKENKKPISEETRAKMRNAKLGKSVPHTKEWNDNIGNGNKGKVRTHEVSLMISKKLMGRKMPKETAKKISVANKGRKKTTQEIAKALLTKKGIEHTDINIELMVIEILTKRDKKNNKRSTEEVNKGISINLKKYFKDNTEARERLSIIQKNKKISEDSITRMKIAQRKRRNKEREDRENGVI